MYIEHKGIWKSILFVIPVFTERERKQFLDFQTNLLELNPKMRTKALIWNPDKIETKKKTYERAMNEWNPTDFNWLGKMKNEEIRQILHQDYDTILILSNDFEERCVKQFPVRESTLKIGFTSDLSFLDVTLHTKESSLQAKLDLIKAYFLKRK
jgi:hypothetical protein